jgi:dipeptidyl aminopeptidase/acylaminoacyl peptidase
MAAFGRGAQTGRAAARSGSWAHRRFAPAYPGVPAQAVGPQKVIAYKAADGLELHGVLTLPAGREPKGLPVIVFPHGGPLARDHLGFDWWAAAMASRGYAVFQPDDISPANLAGKADAPILLIHGKDDTVVPIEQSRIMERALKGAGKPVELVVLDGEDHYLSREPTRVAMLKALVAFVEKYDPPN